MRVRNLTVVFTDVKGFTAETSRRSRRQLATLLETHEKITNEAVDEFNGEIIKNLGDGFLIIFASSTNALLAARRLQEYVRKYNLNVPDMSKFELKISVASGDVIFKNDDVFGEPVNLASRVLGMAEPGQIYFTQSVYLAMNKNEVPVEEIGERQLKGLTEAIRIYKVRRKGTPSLRRFLVDTRDLLQRSFALRYVRYAFLFILLILILNGFGKEQSSDNIKGIEDVRIPTPEATNYTSLSPNPSPSALSTSKPVVKTTSSPSASPESTESGNTEEGNGNFFEELFKNSKGQFKGLLKKLGLE